MSGIWSRRVEAAGHVMSQVADRKRLTAQARNTLDQHVERQSRKEAEAERLQRSLEDWLDKWKPVWEGQRHHG